MVKRIMLLAAMIFVCCFAGAVQGSPLFSISSGMEWEEALGDGRVRPMQLPEWNAYMSQWKDYLIEGKGYPENVFSPATLYVYDGSDGGGDVNGGSGGGLVMAWDADGSSADNSYSSAWVYVYPQDPDLSDCTITISVLAPQFDNNGNQINAVSFGMRDNNGLIRSWYWNVGAPGDPLQWGVLTTVTINTAVPGVAAASPVASGYASNPGFNILMVVDFIVDENAIWVGGPAPVPPPGTVDAKPWNYWYDLSVTANPSNPIIVGTNFDVHMDVGDADTIANDFHIEGSIESGPRDSNWAYPPVLISHVDDLFTNFNISITPDPTGGGTGDDNWFDIAIDWSGADVPYCSVIHLGLKFEVTCHNIIIDLEGWWTLDGVQMQNGLNGGFVPIVGFDVQDGVGGDPSQQGLQTIQLRNDSRAIDTEIVSMSLISMSPVQLSDKLGDDPFGELTVDGRQKDLPWIPVGLPDPTGTLQPISENNPQSFPADSFFDVFFEVTVGDELPSGTGAAVSPVRVGAGDFLLSKQLLRFIANDGQQELRWFFEMHEAHQENHDLGDAPDSTNNHGATALMTAYPTGVGANYPTVYQSPGSPPHGPIHWLPEAVAYLGEDVTGELEADIGFDMDTVNNIIPLANAPDKDVADDGVLGLPLMLTPCKMMRFQYLVNVITPTQALYVNVWFDYNRDGDWDDADKCIKTSAAGIVTSIATPEWSVQNQVLTGLPVGLHTVTTPGFRPYQPSTVGDDDPIWMRITLSETPIPATGYNSAGTLGDGGSGPAIGYQHGETEDYYFHPKLTDDPDVNNDGITNILDLTIIARDWLNIRP
jgi:hypothetical protein